MSIMIKGIDMPINCARCPCCDDETRFCRAANEYIPMLGKPNFCPLMEAEERKTGYWEDMSWRNYIGHRCSVCGESCATYVLSKPRDRYCKWCGARMEVRANET